MIKGYFDIPGEFRKSVIFDTLPEPKTTVVLHDDETGTSRHVVRRVEHVFYRIGKSGFRDQDVIVYLSEEDAAV